MLYKLNNKPSLISSQFTTQATQQQTPSTEREREKKASMGVFDVSEEDEAAASHTPKLSYFSLPISQSPEPAGMLTPPFRSSGSVPFQWEVAPGKPRTCSSINNNSLRCESARCLELPPRLASEVKISTSTSSSSPTTVFEGPYMARSCSYSVPLTRERKRSSFGSPEQQHGVMGKILSKDQDQRAGSFREWVKKGLRGNRRVAEDNFSISPSSSTSYSSSSVEHTGNTKITRTASLSTLSLSSNSNTRSHFWASISGTLKHVVPNPWRSKKMKNKKRDGPGLTM